MPRIDYAGNVLLPTVAFLQAFSNPCTFAASGSHTHLCTSACCSSDLSVRSGNTHVPFVPWLQTLYICDNRVDASGLGVLQQLGCLGGGHPPLAAVYYANRT